MDTAKKSKTIIDQGAGSKIEAIIAKPESQNANTFRRVDFNHPELCAQTKPITCIIKGQEVLLKKKKWSHLLVAITERFIADDNPKLEILKNEPLYGQKSFFLTQKSLSGTCAKLSNGNWIYTNYNPQNIVTIIRNLCHHCDLNSDDVLINYESKDYAPLRVSQECSQPTCVATITPPRQQLDPIVIEQLTDILSSHFSNGYILSSSIEMLRLRSFASEKLGLELKLSNEDLKHHIVACGTNYAGKIYVVSSEIKNRVKKLAENYFIEGAKVIFFDEFFIKNEGWIFEEGIISDNMLAEILLRLFPKLFFTQSYFGYINAPIPSVLESEILRVWGDDALLTYDQLSERLSYIPLKRIKDVLSQNRDFIWNNKETFSHISRIKISDKEKEAIRDSAQRECNARGYVSLKDLPLGDIEGRNYALSVTAIHNAVYRICLSDKFDRRDKIVTRKGDVLDALTIMKEYCQAVDKCSLEDLFNYGKELTGKINRSTSMEAANAILVRVDKESYVSRSNVHFDVDMIDEAIELLVKDDYLPLKSITTFGPFPDCGQSWNLFLLESYCRGFSKRFRFDAPWFNSRNAGAVIRKSCAMDYIEVMTDAVANSDVSLEPALVGNFLFERGYTGKRTNTKIKEIIEKAKNIRERRN